ncbi:MAG: hypothetical protein ACK4UJ_07415 [Leptonema sp. (in: bacteria)]
MKYYYKSPEQVRKEIEEHIKKNKVSPYSRPFQIIFLNIILIVVIFFIFDKTGILKRVYDKKIPEVHYAITDALDLYFLVQKTLILVDSKTNPDLEGMLQIHKIEIFTNQKLIEIYPEFPKTILDKTNNKISISLKEKIDPDSVSKVFLTINRYRKEINKKNNLR